MLITGVMTNLTLDNPEAAVPSVVSQSRTLSSMTMKSRTSILILTTTVVLCSSPGSGASPLTTGTMRWAEDTFDKAGASELASRLPQPGEFWPGAKLPFSFVYDGKASDTLLESWTRQAASQDAADRSEHSAHWTDPATGLKVSASATAFKDFPAVEWVLRFENTGTADTPILENVQALDMLLSAAAKQRVVLDQINGDDCSERSFAPVERELKPGQQVALAPVGGRPSNGTFPFFNVQQGERGIFVALGWTGQWAASLRRDTNGSVRVQAGMELTHLRLHPGESIRTPRILLLRWSGDRLDAHNQFRRLLLAHYLPKLDGQPVPTGHCGPKLQPSARRRAPELGHGGGPDCRRQGEPATWAATRCGLTPAGLKATSRTASATGFPSRRSFPTA